MQKALDAVNSERIEKSNVDETCLALKIKIEECFELHNSV